MNDEVLLSGDLAEKNIVADSPIQFTFIGRSVAAGKTKTSAAAWIALVVSLISAGFSIYQWRNGLREARINSSIELSKAYLADHDVPRNYAMILDFALEKPRDNEAFLRERSFVDRIDYISHLANEGQIDNAYLVSRLKCDIDFIASTVGPKRPDLQFAMTEIVRYAKSHPRTDCPEYRPR
jgi:hypothetical protein